MFYVIVAFSFGYEYYRRMKRHQLVIESLKQGTLPEVTIQKEAMPGMTLVILFAVLFIGFLLFLSYFLLFSGKMAKLSTIYSMLILIPPYGIGLTLVLIVRRNYLAIRGKKETILGTAL